MPKPSPRLARIVASVLLAAMTVLLWPLLTHRSINGAWLGRFSTSYVGIILIYLFAMASTVCVIVSPRRRALVIADSLRAPGYCFLVFIYCLIMGIPLAVYIASGDRDFRHLAFLMLGTGVIGLWVIALLGRRIRPWLNRLALATGAFLVGLAAIEIALRLLNPGGDALHAHCREKAVMRRYQMITILGEASPRTVLVPDPVLGYRQQPNRSLPSYTMPYWVVDDEPRTDEWGFFNSGVDLNQPTAAAAVGDSFVGGGWPNMLSQSLAKERKESAVLNLGVPGYGPPQYTEVLRRWGLRARPKVVFYCLFANDALDAEYWDRWHRSGLDWFTWKWMLYGAQKQHLGVIVLERWMLEESMIYCTVEWLKFRLSNAGKTAESKPLKYTSPTGELVFDRVAYEYYTAIDKPAAETGFTLIKQSIAEAKKLCDDAGARMVILIFPMKEWAYMDALRAVAPKGDPIDNIGKHYARLDDLCAKSGIEYHDLTPAFRAAIARGDGPLYFPVDIHLTKKGNQLVADTVKQYMK